MASFSELGLSDTALKAVERLGYSEPTPVQSQAIPLVLEDDDIIAAAKTGTGKTAAFALPALDRLPRKAPPKSPYMLVITPTRELAAQISDVCSTIAEDTGHRIVTVIGAVGAEPQIQQLKEGADVLVATPGRLLDLMERGAVSLSHVQVLVLDEADRMLDMGFLPQVSKIVKATPRKRQTLLFSATIDESIMSQVGSMLHDPELVKVSAKGDTADTVEEYLVHVPHTLKAALLIALLRDRGSERVLVFARTRHRADATCRKLRRAGFSVAAIHSDRSQNQRTHALEGFADGSIDVLVATDVLARGIDVEEVSYVVNYDIPNQPEDYVHRIGRTGRAGAAGCAISFVSPENLDDLNAIEKLVHHTIPEMTVEGFDIEEAASEAAAKAAKASDGRDREIAAAKRKAAKKSRGGAGAGSAKSNPQSRSKQQGSSKKGRNTPANTSSRQKGQQSKARSDQGSQRKATKSPPAKAQSKQSRGGNAKGRPKAPRSTSKGSKRGAEDMRPGRANRALIANRRRHQNRGGR